MNHKLLKSLNSIFGRALSGDRGVFAHLVQGGFTGDSEECIELGLRSAVVLARVPKFDVVSSRGLGHYPAGRCRGEDHFKRKPPSAFIAMPDMQSYL